MTHDLTVPADQLLHDVRTSRVYDVAQVTPLENAPLLSRRLGNNILLKREDLQPVFSFKLRGAYNRMAHLSAEERGRGVLAASAGNHGQGVAYSARRLGIKAVIVMPRTTPRIKVDAVRDLGAEAVLEGDTYPEAEEHCSRLEASTGMILIHPFDGPLVIAGQGTIADEIFQDVADQLDAVFVPVGGGGLIAGIAGYLKVVAPAVKVIGVVPFEADAMYRSREAGRRVTLDTVGIFADGVAVREVGEATFAIVQAEDELAAIGMALGAGWAGARSLTSTSGPGISLMSEFVGLGYYAEIPAVIWNIQRVGPSTGLPTRTAQGDILFTHLLSQGDTKHICLIPASVDECFEYGMEAFNLSERFQTPVFVLSDLDLGMNYWMAEPFPYPEKPLDRGKVLTAKDLEKLGSFGRYRDVDGDGIPYRTLPGTNHPAAAYFTRGSGHGEDAEYTERPDDYQNNMDRLARKFETARTHVPAPVIVEEPGAEVGMIAFGSSHWAVTEARDQLRLDKNLRTRYLRLRALPFTEDLRSFVRSCKRVYVIEQNRDAQMAQLIRLELSNESGQQDKIRSVLHYNGLPLDARSVFDGIAAAEGKESNDTAARKASGKN